MVLARYSFTSRLRRAASVAYPRSSRLTKNVAGLVMLPVVVSTLAGACFTSEAVLAQTSSSTTNYARFEAASEKALQLGYYASANADCTPARRPTIRVIESPRLGTLTVQLGDLTTDRFATCQKVTMPARVVSYEARKGDDATDRLIYEVTYANGDVGVYEVTIDIGKVHKPVTGAAREGTK